MTNSADKPAPPRLSPADAAAANAMTTRWWRAQTFDDGQAPAAMSGAGIWPLLAALSVGAGGSTRAELAEAVGVPATEASDVVAAFAATLADSPAVRLAVGLWEGRDITMDPQWLDDLPADWLGSLSGDPAADKATLDSWADECTGGLISSMPISLPVDVALATALAIRTSWVTPFVATESTLGQGPWRMNGPCPVLTATSGDVNDLRVVDGEVTVVTVRGRDDVDVLLVIGEPDADSHTVMTTAIESLASPGAGIGGHELPAGGTFPGGRIRETETEYPDSRPILQITTVEFDVSGDHDLLAHADVFGLGAAAGRDTADFPGLSAEAAWIEQAAQSCLATFSATGFEAAAVTAVGVALAAADSPSTAPARRREISVEFLRPFGYLAVHRHSSLVLVAGWVHQPDRTRPPDSGDGGFATRRSGGRWWRRR